jgi:hypothetical protein
MSVTLATLALYNMSYLAPNQPVIGRTCLPALLQVCQRCEGLPEATATQPPLTRTLVVSAHRCAVASLQNIMRHPANRTEFYKVREWLHPREWLPDAFVSRLQQMLSTLQLPESAALPDAFVSRLQQMLSTLRSYDEGCVRGAIPYQRSLNPDKHPHPYPNPNPNPDG